jgi:peptidoglycan/LPS O-acetylase OafA/YrhL
MWLTGIAAKSYLAHLDATGDRSLEQLTFGSHGTAVLAESTVALADVFATGMLGALVFVLIAAGRLPGWTGARLHRAAGAVIVLSGAAALVALKAQSAFANAFLAIAAGTLLVVVTEPTARGRRSPLGRLLDVRPLKYLGATSLSIYLWHFPVIVLVTRWDWYGADSLPGALWSVLLVASTSVALAAITYRFVELPAMRYRRRDPVHGRSRTSPNA